MSRRRHLLLTAREEGADAFFIEFPWSRATPHLRSLFQLLTETPTHFASEAENPQEAQRKTREVSTHNFLMKACTAQWLLERLGGWREAGRALRAGSTRCRPVASATAQLRAGAVATGCIQALSGTAVELWREAWLSHLTFYMKVSSPAVILSLHKAFVPDLPKHHNLQ